MAIDYSWCKFKKTSRPLEKIERDRAAGRIERKCREKVDLRDGRRCFFPGCKTPASDKHHVRPRSLMGQWVSSNILSSCRKHHDWFKAQFIRVTGNPDKGTVKVFLTQLGAKARIRIPRRDPQLAGRARLLGTQAAPACEAEARPPHTREAVPA